MSRRRIETLISILMESPLYMGLPLKERFSLLIRLLKEYPSSFEDRYDEGIELGYESSWRGISIHSRET